MKRREFLRSLGVGAAVAATPFGAKAFWDVGASFSRSESGVWRTDWILLEEAESILKEMYSDDVVISLTYQGDPLGGLGCARRGGKSSLQLEQYKRRAVSL